MGRYLPKEYTGATMTLILEPIDFLDSAQVKFLAKAFSLGRYSHKLKEKFCDRQPHILQQNIHPELAQQLSKQLSDRNIPHKFAIEPPIQ